MRSWAFLILSLLAACGDEVAPADPTVPPTGGGGAGGQLPTPLGITVRAPTETTVEVTFSGAPPAAGAEASSYQIGGEAGPLAITAVTLEGRTATLTTERQKLGIHYELTFQGEEVLTESFPSADTARFWTVDLGSPTFDEYQVTADRKAIGDHAVVYVAQGQSGAGYQEALTLFDQDVYPIETALFEEPGDIDDNGKVVLLGLDGKGAYGGYFNPLNAMTDEETMSQWGRHSNEMEMLYISVETGSWYADQVLAHEFQHLLYNERHGWEESWEYHNEGLSECAVNAVHGTNDYAVAYYVADPSGQIANGVSLVHWEYANYDNYVLAYVFLSYIAGQLGGSAVYGELFEQNGNPHAIEQYLQDKLGLSFGEAQLRALAATQIQAPTGPFGFEGLITLPGSPPVAASPPSQLLPFAGTLVSVTGDTIDYSGAEGEHVIFAGLDGDGGVDFEAPFDVSSGLMVVLNQRFDLVDGTPEPTGLPLPKSAALEEVSQSRARLHPPPFDPRLERMRRWQRQALR